MQKDVSITAIPPKIVNKEVPQTERGSDKDKVAIDKQSDTGETRKEKEIADIKVELKCMKAMMETLSEKNQAIGIIRPEIVNSDMVKNVDNKSNLMVEAQSSNDNDNQCSDDNENQKRL